VSVTNAREGIAWLPKVTLEKWDDSEAHDRGEAPDSVEHYEGNLLMTAGATRLLSLLIGTGGQAYDATHSRIGVGDSTASESAAQTDLQGTNKYFKLVDATFPSVTSATATWKSTFGSAQGNFAWQEWGIDVGTADGATVTAPLLNRKVQSFGTKGSGTTWSLTVAISIA
jgi:hypothetical protein